MKREPEKPLEQEEPAAEEPSQTCKDAELEQVSGGIKTRQKGSAPGFSPGSSIDL